MKKELFFFFLEGLFGKVVFLSSVEVTSFKCPLGHQALTGRLPKVTFCDAVLGNSPESVRVV